MVRATFRATIAMRLQEDWTTLDAQSSQIDVAQTADEKRAAIDTYNTMLRSSLSAAVPEGQVCLGCAVHRIWGGQ